MRRTPTWTRRGTVAALTLLALLLAACGAETTTSGLRGGATPHASATGGTPTANATPGAPPYTLPKSWQAAAGAPTQVSLIHGMAFAPSQPLTGYACNNAPPPSGAGSSASQVSVYLTQDGGQTWTSAPSSPTFQQPGTCAVFVDPANANDVLVNDGPGPSGQPAPSIWRSQDGGATWHQLTAPTVAGWPSISVIHLTVLGARIVAMVAINGEGQLPNDLYASDDDGATWHQFAASLPANVEDFVTLGGAIIVQSTPPTPGSTDRPAPANTARVAGDQVLAATARLSSGGPASVFYRSDDGGNTWATVTIPGGLPIFTQAATGNNYYGVSLAAPVYQMTFATAYWTQDSGATWKTLPTLENVEGNWLDPNSLGYGLTVGPDGSVYTDTQHWLGGNNGNADAGIFVLHPGDGTPAWQPLAPDAPYCMAAVPVNGSVRLVNVQETSTTANTGTPVYLNLP